MDTVNLYNIFLQYKTYFSSLNFNSLLFFKTYINYLYIVLFFVIVKYYFTFNYSKEDDLYLDKTALNHKFGDLASKFMDLKQEFDNFLKNQQIKTNQNIYEIKILKEENSSLRTRIEEIEEALYENEN